MNEGKGRINWDIRVRSALFWTTLIPAVLLLFQQVLAMFGVVWDVSGLQEHLLGIVGTVFAILTILGIVVDPTTEGVADSARALSYTEQAPNVDETDGKDA